MLDALLGIYDFLTLGLYYFAVYIWSNVVAISMTFIFSVLSAIIIFGEIKNA